MAAITNFRNRISSLSDSASRETIQTLSKYMTFHRKKYGERMTLALLDAIKSPSLSSTRKVTLLAIVHEALIADSPASTMTTTTAAAAAAAAAAAGASSAHVAGGSGGAVYGNERRWERNADFRLYLGETIVVPAAECIRDAVAAEGVADNDDEDDDDDGNVGAALSVGASEVLRKVRDMAQVWEDVNAFGGPTIAHSARMALVAPPRRVARKRGAATKTTTTTKTTKKTTEAETAQVDVEGEVISADAKADADRSMDGAAGTTAPAPATAAAAAADNVDGGDDDAASYDSPSRGGDADASSLAERKRPRTPSPSHSELEAMVASEEAGWKDGDNDGDGDGGKSPTLPPSSASTPNPDQNQTPTPTPQEEQFDFEAQGIPAGRVEARELLEPCKSLASMQIARELRNDTTVQLSNILNSISEETMDMCRAINTARKRKEEEKKKSTTTTTTDKKRKGIADEGKKKDKITTEGGKEGGGGGIKGGAKGDGDGDIGNKEEGIKDEDKEEVAEAETEAEVETKTADKELVYPDELPDDVLDLDLNDALASVREYRDIILRQREARALLIRLLIKSRCMFGSDDSAAEFMAAAAVVDKLRKRRVLLRDAMELEGLDMVEDVDEGLGGVGGGGGGDDDNEDGGADLAPLDWYKPGEGVGVGGGSDSKRIKLE